MKTSIIYFLTTLIVAMAAPLLASSLTVPSTFTAGMPAVAADVNGNFSAVEIAVNDNDDRLAVLESMLKELKNDLVTAKATITVLQTALEDINNSNIMALDPYMSVTSDDRGPIVTLSGINLQIVNGLEATDTINGLGNLIIGYDEINTDQNIINCSDGAYQGQVDCEGNGATWSRSHKTGSHYLVLGSANSYSQYGGLVSGISNFATGQFSSVTGGSRNTASGLGSIVSGGWVGTASGINSSVSGGWSNFASGTFSSVSGGQENRASGYTSSISGGLQNDAIGQNSSISGGLNNWAREFASSVNGGIENSTRGAYSSVSGGFRNIASGSSSTVGGGIRNTASGNGSTVSGGQENTASGDYSNVSGGENRSVAGESDWAAGSLFEDL